ncbi:MAG: hypothetical protein ACOVN4_00645 [Bosea sp. (in: a-proteobacteria)]
MSRVRPLMQRVARLAMLALFGATLPGCSLMPAINYGFSTLPLIPADGWVPLPAARWLLNPGIEPDVLTFCPAQACPREGFVATIELSGREREVAHLLMTEPVRVLSAARPTLAATRKDTRSQKTALQQARGRTSVAPVTVGAWRGGLVTLHPAKTGGRPAHVVILGWRSREQARLLIAVGASAEAAEAHARQAIE